MKKIILYSLVPLLFWSFSSFADQPATMKCTGTRVVLQVRSPYLGENVPYQSLYVLSAKDDAGNEAANTAYFLNVSIDGAGASTGGLGTFIHGGRNEIGGEFLLTVGPRQDIGNGTVIHEVAQGKISYNFGNRRGVDEPVRCEWQ